MKTGSRLLAWLDLSRPPFHTVGVLPFLLGTIMAWRLDGAFNLNVLLLGIAGVIAVMLAAYFAGEYWDFEEDSISRSLGLSRFSGGSGVLQEGRLARVSALRASVASLLSATLVGILLQFGYKTGPWTLPLGLLGMVAGFFYSTKPLRWVSRGVGEVLIALCYGWLPIAAGYYIQSGRIHPLVFWTSLPVSLTIFNVILLNEIPDYEPDRQTGKSNLVVRLGRRMASIMYLIVVLLTPPAFLIAVEKGLPAWSLLGYLPVALLALHTAQRVFRREWGNRLLLERLCASTLAVNLGTTGAMALSFGW